MLAVLAVLAMLAVLAVLMCLFVHISRIILFVYLCPVPSNQIPYLEGNVLCPFAGFCSWLYYTSTIYIYK